MDSAILQGVMVVVAPTLLALALAYAMLRNRASRADTKRTEAATRRLYEEQERIDAERDAR